MQVNELTSAGHESDAHLVRRAAVIAGIVAVRRAFLFAKERDDRVVDVDPHEAVTKLLRALPLFGYCWAL